ncbi:type II secretion system F family protein [Candidatus Microgenomates bacterium]|nr:type II secretion system F family protein [Candidatus Microgenomates bacterium]
MKQFEYKALDDQKKQTTGLIESLTIENAAKTLQERKLLIINLKEKTSFSLNNITIGSKVSQREIAVFTRLLSTMLSTGLPLTDAISNLSSQSGGAYFKDVLRNILHDVQSGVSLSESMAHNKDVFDELYINMVKAGEASGKVDQALEKLADTLESNLEFKSKVTGAMIYPAVIVVVMSVIGVFMITSIIPKVADVYKQFGAELPLPTQILVGLSDVLTHYTIFVAIFAGLVFYTVKVLRKNPSSDFLINNAALKAPIFGDLNKEVMLALMCRTLGTLLASGVAILEAIKIVSKTIPNNKFRAGLVDAGAFVEKGLPLSIAFRRNQDFPQMISQLVAIGEETGTLDESLDRLASFYQEAAERKVKNLTTLLEPLMILLMGGMVAGLAVAVLLPMFNLVNIVK